MDQTAINPDKGAGNAAPMTAEDVADVIEVLVETPLAALQMIETEMLDVLDDVADTLLDEDGEPGGRTKAGDGESALSEALGDLAEHIGEMVEKLPKFYKDMLKKTYESRVGGTISHSLLRDADDGEAMMPQEVRFVDAASLHGAMGSYEAGTGGTVYLNEDLIDDPAGLRAELDAQLAAHFDTLMADAEGRGT